jgi:hypothetical protein
MARSIQGAMLIGKDLTFLLTDDWVHPEADELDQSDSHVFA